MTSYNATPSCALMLARKAKLEKLKESGDAYPNDFRRDTEVREIRAAYDSTPAKYVKENAHTVRLAGRLMAKRVMGKASFVNLQDTTGRIQLYVHGKQIGAESYEAFKTFDIGDIVGAVGTVFVTQKGELSVKLTELRMLVKSLRPLPEKFHGISDQEMRYRQRYVDLIVTEKSRQTFKARSKTINAMRRFLTDRKYLEIESPMMQAIPGGATAKPFITHHNALDMDLYLRVAQELPIKRTLVGGFDRVFELNRVFRNEGLSTRHNPEFTMMECNEAYVNYQQYMDMTESMLRHCAQEVLDSSQVEYQGETFDFGKPFARVTMRNCVLQHNPELSEDMLADAEKLAAYAKSKHIEIEPGTSVGKLLLTLFEETAEEKLRSPTFVIDHPVEVSPFARRCAYDPSLTERFELFIGGREIANGFSELNDAEDQAQRFAEQVAQKDAGDEEALYFDHDYIRALEIGLPPNAGLGVGVDRLVMILTDSPSIRDVILFPHMRPVGTNNSGESYNEPRANPSLPADLPNDEAEEVLAE